MLYNEKKGLVTQEQNGYVFLIVMHEKDVDFQNSIW